MSTQPPILAAEQRSWDYWFVDGLTNLVVGLNTLLMAFCLSNPLHWLRKPPAVALSLAAMVLYVGITTRYRQIVEWLKTKTTYPRTGYVQPPGADEMGGSLVTLSLHGPAPEIQLLRMQRRTTWMIAVFLAALASFSFVLIHARWIWSATGALFSVAMIIARKDFKMSWIPPVGFPLLGLYITTFVPAHLGGSYFITGMGLLFVLDGATTLIRYILQNPKGPGV